MNKNKLLIGDKIYVVNNDLVIEEHVIHGITVTKEGEPNVYSISDNACRTVKDGEFFVKKSLAEVFVHETIKACPFVIGDPVIFKYWNDYAIGVVDKIYLDGNVKVRYVDSVWSGAKYTIEKSSELTRINDSYLENFGDLKELRDEMVELYERYSELSSKINKEFDKLYADLKLKFKKFEKKDKSWFIKKTIFKDIFLETPLECEDDY